MKGPLYDRSSQVQAREKEVILQPGNQGLVIEQIDFAAFLNSTGQVLYGYSVNGSVKEQIDFAAVLNSTGQVLYG